MGKKTNYERKEIRVVFGNVAEMRLNDRSNGTSEVLWLMRFISWGNFINTKQQQWRFSDHNPTHNPASIYIRFLDQNLRILSDHYEEIVDTTVVSWWSLLK